MEIHCIMCKKKVDLTSKFIIISCENGYGYFHRFCYFNYRTKI